MALPVSAQRAAYPLALYNFRVKVAETAMSFTEVSGIAIDHDHATYRHGLSFAEGEDIVTFYFDSFIPITCKRGTILGGDPLFLHDWLTRRDLRSMEISLCDADGSPVMSWKIAAAVPVSLKAPGFSAASSDAAIDTVELRARGVSLVKL